MNVTVITGAILLFSTLCQASTQTAAGIVHLKNGTREDIDVYFYSNQSDKTNQKPCKAAIKTVGAGKSTRITPRNCLINRIEVRHTPEEEHEQVTTEELSAQDQTTETWWTYKGPNILVPEK